MSPTHRYPGINYPLRLQTQTDDSEYPFGAEDSWGAESELLPVREVFMMALMESLTNKTDWYKKIMDEGIVAKWRKEALEQSEEKLYLQITEAQYSRDLPMPRRILSEAAFDYCIKELREKSSHFEKTGLIPVLDSSGAAVVKSDTVVNPALRQEVRNAFQKLRADQASKVDWHPHSNEMVQDLVHPSMYPFIFGKSQFIQEEVVLLSDSVDVWTGKGKIPPLKTKIEWIGGRNPSWDIAGSEALPQYWSEKYQWLPANMSFQEDGTAKFTSYINNLHPEKYPEIYRTIEKLVDTAVPAWDQCLKEYRRAEGVGAGRQRSRFSLPAQLPEEKEDDHLWDPFNTEILASKDFELERFDLDCLESDYEKDEAPTAEDIQRFKWRFIREPIFPEPDDATEIDYKCPESIREKFKASGLQVIVKMASIELTPEKPEFPAGGWHIEGQMNERICATALYYVDSENITPSHLSFRMHTSGYQDELQGISSQDNYNWLERFYGTSLSPGGGYGLIQHYGNTESREGRLLAFPNVFQHRVSSFKLQDPTKSGHRRFIALWLVDPHRRIVSTANVPPQQLDWWKETAAGISQLESGGDVPEGLMSVEEAEKHRLALMEVRTRFHVHSKESWEEGGYGFCEH